VDATLEGSQKGMVEDAILQEKKRLANDDRREYHSASVRSAHREGSAGLGKWKGTLIQVP
jgi:hypothetical protein